MLVMWLVVDIEYNCGYWYASLVLQGASKQSSMCLHVCLHKMYWKYLDLCRLVCSLKHVKYLQCTAVDIWPPLYVLCLWTPCMQCVQDQMLEWHDVTIVGSLRHIITTYWLLLLSLRLQQQINNSKIIHVIKHTLTFRRIKSVSLGCGVLWTSQIVSTMKVAENDQESSVSRQEEDDRLVTILHRILSEY